MFHSFHWPLDVKQLTSFMWRKGVYFMPCIDTKYFVSFLLCLPIIRCFTHDWKKACMWWSWKRDWPFAPLVVMKHVAFLSWQKKRCSWFVRCFQIHQHPCCMYIDPSYHHAHCLWLLFFALEEIWPTYYLMTQIERNINPLSFDIHIQILQTDLYTFP